MTEQQREYLERSLNVLERESTKYEEKQDKACAEGDSEKVRILDYKIERVYAEMEGMKTVLNCLGYTAKCDLIDGKYKYSILDNHY